LKGILVFAQTSSRDCNARSTSQGELSHGQVAALRHSGLAATQLVWRWVQPVLRRNCTAEVEQQDDVACIACASGNEISSLVVDEQKLSKGYCW